jgi:hypothetical protein
VMGIIYKDKRELMHHRDVINENKFSIRIQLKATIQTKQYSKIQLISFQSLSKQIFTKGTGGSGDIELNRTNIVSSF